MKRTHQILLIIFVCLVSLPLIQTQTHIFKLKPLKGAITNVEQPMFHIESWFNTSYQGSIETYLNDKLGFRPFFIRVRNQILYSFFGQAKAIGVVQGKDNYLYELNYIKAYNGLDFVGLDSIHATTQRIVRSHQYLDSLGKTLVVCLAAGKGSFYPEYFPEEYQNAESDTTNYKLYSKKLKEAGVNIVDFNDWFLRMKDTSRHILYPQYGIHWSQYGMLLAADSLVNYIESIKQIDMPNIEFMGYKVSSRLKYTDYDIADGMNLLFQMKSEPMCYPEHKWEDSEGKTKPKTLVIADSFYWGMFNTGMGKQSFDLGEFWFYYNQIYPASDSLSNHVKDRSLKNEIENNDVVLIIATEATLPRIGWGFFEDKLFE